MLQRSDPKFIKPVLCISDSYYIFLGMTIQSDDVVKCAAILIMCYLLTEHLIYVQVGFLTAAILITILQQMRVNIRYF